MTKEQAQDWLRKYGYQFKRMNDDNGFAFVVVYPTKDSMVTGYTRTRP